MQNPGISQQGWTYPSNHLKSVRPSEPPLLTTLQNLGAKARLDDKGELIALHLGGTEITDARLEQLKGLSSLETLDLTETKVTVEGINKLKQALPDCKMMR